MRLRIISSLALLGVTLAATVGATAARPSPYGSWAGQYTLRGEDAVSVVVARGRATVALGPGHAAVQTVPADVRGDRVRFSLPGRPARVIFEGRLRAGRLEGTVRQGALRGSFRMRRGQSRRQLAAGHYRAGDARLAVVDSSPGVPRLVNLDTGEVHGLFPAGTRFEIGSGFATRAPVSGTASFTANGATIAGIRAPRIRLRQLEVRFASAGHTLAGTLTLPEGNEPHPAVAWVHGGGFVRRDYFPDLQALLVGSGVAVLAYDKQGVGQSGGRYDWNLASEETIGALARDAEAAARWLAAQPELDRARVGLAGHSQGGWIVPLAAAREPAVRFAIAFAGPSVSQGETDYWSELAGGGSSPPTGTDDELEAEVLRRGPSGFDPLPSLRALGIPSLWLFGGVDRTVPTRLSVGRLEALAVRDVTVEIFPRANHALVETQTGLNAEMLRSDRFAPGLFPRVREWLKARGLAR
jgi:dienelactone hydrolase